MRPSDRRKTPRVPIHIPAEIRLKAQPERSFDAKVLDISTGGAFVHCTAPILIGQEISLQIFFKKAEVFEAKVTDIDPKRASAFPDSAVEKSIVRWVRGSSKSGFGVEFVEVAPEQKKFLQLLVDFFQEQEKLNAKD